MSQRFDNADLSRIIEMAWEDRTPFEAIEQLYNLNEPAVIKLMHRELKPRSFRLWRARVSGRTTKHLTLTVSAGLASSSNNILWQDMLSQADQALYEAKQNGRNQICHFSGLVPQTI